MRRPSHYNPTAYDDDWEDQPNRGAFYQWGLSVILALALVGYGAGAVGLRRTQFGGRIEMKLLGANAVAFGIACVSAGVFVHCHYFWGNLYNQAWFAILGKIVAACGFIAGLGFVLLRNGVLGMR